MYCAYGVGPGGEVDGEAVHRNYWPGRYVPCLRGAGTGGARAVSAVSPAVYDACLFLYLVPLLEWEHGLTVLCSLLLTSRMEKARMTSIMDGKTNIYGEARIMDRLVPSSALSEALGVPTFRFRKSSEALSPIVLTMLSMAPTISIEFRPGIRRCMTTAKDGIFTNPVVWTHL